ARERKRHGSHENDERIAEALELRREHEINKDARQRKGSEKRGSLGAKLTRLPRVVDREALAGGQNPCGLVLERAKRGVQRDRWRNHSLDPHRIQLLEAFELPRLRRRLERGERGERHELVV